MKKMLYFLPIAALAVGLWAKDAKPAATAKAKPAKGAAMQGAPMGGGMMPGMMGGMAPGMMGGGPAAIPQDATEEQKKKLEELRAKQEGETKALQRKVRDLSAKLGDLVEDKASDKELLSGLKALKAARKDMAEAEEKMADERDAIFTPIQQAKMALRNRGRGMSMGRSMGMGKGPGMGMPGEGKVPGMGAGPQGGPEGGDHEHGGEHDPNTARGKYND